MSTMLKKLVQVCTEDKFSKRNIRERVIKDIKDTELGEVFAKCVDRLDSYMSKDYWESKNKRTAWLRNSEITTANIVAELFIAVVPVETPEPIQNTAAKLGRKLEFPDVFDGVRTGAEILAVCNGLGLYELFKPGVKGQYLSLQCNFQLSKETRQFINETQFLPPMVVPPNEVTSNNNCGRLTLEDSVLLGNQTHHNEQVCLDVLNKLNNIGFKLNIDMLNKPHPSKSQLTGIDKKNFDQYVKECTEVQQYLLNEDNNFWFVHQYDFRGRIYASGYHINYQGTQYNKSIIELATPEVIEI